MARQSAIIKSPQREILGVVLFAAAAVVLLGLASFSPHDAYFGHGAEDGVVRNIAGRVGSYLAGGFYGFLGLAAFLVPVVFLAAGVCLLARRSPERKPALVAGLALLLVSACGLLGMVPEWRPFGFAAGGWLGLHTSGLLLALLNATGGVIVLATLLIAGLVLTLKVSPGDWYLAAEDKAKEARVALVEAARRRREELRRRAEKGGKAVKAAKALAAPEPEAKPAPPGIITQSPVVIETPERPDEGAACSPTQALPDEEDLPGFEPSARAETTRQLPPLALLAAPGREARTVDRETLLANSRLLEEKLRNFGVEGRVVEVTPGPVVTMYEFEPAPGVKINRIANLSDDLALALKALSIRIVAPIPKKGVVGIEIPNSQREQVLLQEIVTADVFQTARSKLTVALGKDIVGHPVVADLARMPHLLIAGATGSGKSVALNSMICSILLKSFPSDVRMLMIDPKRIELSVYEGIPHLLHPVLTDAKKATAAMRWAVNEMEERYRLLARLSARNIDGYNAKLRAMPLTEQAGEDPEESTEPPLRLLPYIVIIIDELSDLMMVSSREVEESMTRLAHMARAAGIHLIVATQRPSVDVLTGVIKANFPTRISFRVSSRVDSRTVIDTMGAEALLGAGDMLFLPPGTSKLQRIHGAYLSDGEIMVIVDFLKRQEEPVYDESIVAAGEAAENGGGGDDTPDERYDEAVELVVASRQASISMVQRRLRVGYNRAARMIEMMEREGVVSSSDGVRPREVLVEK
ncbi:MAG: DNA translocase FtsK 4TM domain-containing protein [Pseudomonadota bacterium]